MAQRLIAQARKLYLSAAGKGNGKATHSSSTATTKASKTKTAKGSKAASGS